MSEAYRLHREKARKGLQLLNEAMLDLLRDRPDGLTNAEIVRALDIPSAYEGKQANYLSYSLLGNLLEAGKVRRQGDGTKRRYLLTR